MQAMGSTATRSVGASTTWVPRAPFDSPFGLLRHITVGGLSGLVAGILVGGIGGRLFMRFAGVAAGERGAGMQTEAGFTVGEITLAGTFALVLFVGIFTGVMGATAYLAFRPWLAWAGRWRGVVFGVVLFGLGSALSDIMNTDNVDFLILRNSELLVALILGLFLAFGGVMDSVFSYLDVRMPGKQDRSKGLIAVYAGLTMIGFLIVAAPGSAGLSLGQLCDCEVPVRAILSYTIVTVATLIFWISSIVKHPMTWVRKFATVVGYLGTLGVVIFGLIRAISDALDIIG
jgi:hypothetical protein